MARLVLALVVSLAAVGAARADVIQSPGSMTPQTVKDGLGWPQGVDRPEIDCTCRPPGGGKAPVGAEICVRRGGAMVTLRCEMELNNTIWREVRPHCGEPLS